MPERKQTKQEAINVIKATIRYIDLVKYQKEGRVNIPGTEYSVYDVIINLGGRELF